MKHIFPVDLAIEFLAPFEDNLNLVMLGDQITKDEVRMWTDAFNYIRRTTLIELQNVNTVTGTTSDLFWGKLNPVLSDGISIVYLDSELSSNTIQFLTNSLDDQMEGMLIDKYLLQVPQEKYIFNINQTDDEDLARLCQNMDKRSAAFNYLICENYLAVWILYQDEFTLIQDTLD